MSISYEADFGQIAMMLSDASQSAKKPSDVGQLAMKLLDVS